MRFSADRRGLTAADVPKSKWTSTCDPDLSLGVAILALAKVSTVVRQTNLKAPVLALSVERLIEESVTVSPRLSEITVFEPDCVA